MKQTLYKTANPTPDDDSFMLQIEEREKQFFVSQYRYRFNSKSGSWEVAYKAIITLYPLAERSEAIQVYESQRGRLASEGYKYAFSPDAFSQGNTYEVITPD